MFDLEENRKKVQSALLIGIQHPKMTRQESEYLLAELAELTRNLDIPIVGEMIIKLRKPTPAFLVGKGKLEEIISIIQEQKIDVIIFDEELSPAQQRNWERESKIAVIDRQEVIIDIFSERAQTKEAVLQVALARMQYSLPRLTRAWTHLSRQRGGGTGARGQGETQLEADRRMINDRIAITKKELKEVIKHRHVQRSKRIRRPVPTISIVGYTNAGKSSLLNKLTQSDALAEDKLFATLDPTTRRLDLDKSQHVLLTDTVGFVRRLPHRLVDAFKATLEEAVVADLLIHLVDVSNPEFESHFETTESVLAEIGATENPRLLVFNKIDNFGDEGTLSRIKLLHKDALYISAATGEGLEALKEDISTVLNAKLAPSRIVIPHDRYDIISKLHCSGGIRHQETEDDGVHIEGLFPESVQGIIAPFIVSQ
ncbi:GTPase HflX [Candidatus Pelagisphaera phototrophica]|uniref:GTPase HflX n=1 Tax=Candidatus Pelagisphaera phototrophica TaxID=2684113 RepID=UPI0019F88C01|nr:GTPase HflX [Candidatus Pelagisphaera phototrophica]QXD31144.1 GTPase HflX [Candidatus Pelagisphaera phototrophica]